MPDSVLMPRWAAPPEAGAPPEARTPPVAGVAPTGAGRPILGAQRRRLILDATRSGAGVQVAELASRFGVSDITVRRDLARLARDGQLTRVHGGAMVRHDEPPFATIEVQRAPAKERVGIAAARLVQDGQTIMIDIGTTTLQLARALHGRTLTVITSSLPVVEDLRDEPGIELVVLGGVLRRNYRSLVGLLAEDALRQLSADIAFLGASGLPRDSLAVMDTTMAEVPIKRGMLAAADRSILLVDAQKFSMGGVVRVCGAEELDIVVTDAGHDEPALDGLARVGVEVVLA